MHWSFSQQCSLVGTVSLRLFDETNGGGWPGGSDVYLLPSATTKTADIACVPGAKICYGAAAGSLYWGGGLDDVNPCSDCCNTCGAGTIAQRNLTCQ